MPNMALWLVSGAITLGVLAVLAYWELIIAEGAHLGQWVVMWLYDLTAHRYERIKHFKPVEEDQYLGLPLVEKLLTDLPAEFDAWPQARVLDVAAGTGRVARALLRQVAFDGDITNLDLAAQMLKHGQHECRQWPERVTWVRGAGDHLPFPSNHFDLVTCLEALEFMPSTPMALAECVRVLKPGGWLVVTNRVGLYAWLMIGKTYSRPAFHTRLESLGLEAIAIRAWQMEYDLALARKRVVLQVDK